MRRAGRVRVTTGVGRREHVGHDPDDRRQFRRIRKATDDAARRPRSEGSTPTTDQPDHACDRARPGSGRRATAKPAPSTTAASDPATTLPTIGLEPDDAGPAGARGPAAGRCRIASRRIASIQAAIAIARREAGQPERPDEDDRRACMFTTTATIAAATGVARVLPGVERPGQDGDQGVRGEPDEERDEAWPP